MTTRTEIIAQIDAEISRLVRARDFLTASLAGLKKHKQAASAIASLKKLKSSPPALRKRRQPEAATAPVAVAAPLPPPPQPKEEPQIKRVPPKRRMERRHLQADKTKSGAALSGQVPTGPVAVSANEARKMQERAVPAPKPPVVAEPRTEASGERSLGSLIQAFERRAGLSGLETS